MIWRRKINLYISANYQNSTKQINDCIKDLEENNFKVSLFRKGQGTYTTKYLDNANVVVILPDPSSLFYDLDDKTWRVESGKGNYNECLRALKLNKRVYVVNKYRNKHYYRKVTGCKVTNEEEWYKHGNIYFLKEEIKPMGSEKLEWLPL